MQQRKTKTIIACVAIVAILTTGEVSSMNTQGGSGSERQESAGGGNRLAGEQSPYLLQHADNPVDWYPWGGEAFERARREDKPIFLSIGYSSCHWCHVMEEESFADGEVAALLNRHFVSIKVDREERPDIDHTYMTICQIMTGSGGWPLTIVMTPEQKPFFAGTYFPKTSRFGRPGLIELLPRIAEMWRDKRTELERAGEQAVLLLSDESRHPAGGELGPETLSEAYRSFSDGFDEANGGFGTAPKFPTPHNLMLLLRLWEQSGNDLALRMVTETLDAMRRGGIYDHLGGGVHRYSTDARWLVPHFEKMLYDQALLAIAFLETHQATGGERFADNARDIFAYVLGRMTSPEGLFYSSEDADSEGVEGKFYVWSREEILEVLGDIDGDLFCSFYGVTRRGHLEGKSVLHIERSLEAFAEEWDMDLSKLREQLEAGRRALASRREGRAAPFKDDKVLTDWNALMIAALAIGGRVLGDSACTDAASRAADVILGHMRRGDGRLLHRFRGGEAEIPAFLDDYAFLVWGLLELYEATFRVRYLEAALELADEMVRLFWDRDGGGFFFTGSDGEEVLTRSKEGYDGAVPSGNSIAALDLLRLGRITGRSGFEEMADRLIKHFAGLADQAPIGFSQLLIAVDFAAGPSKEIVIAGDPAADDTAALLEVLRVRFAPRKVVLLRPGGEDLERITKIAPFTEAMTPVDGRATAYVCENYICNRPVTDAAGLERLLGGIGGER